jgi:hypothetical protein
LRLMMGVSSSCSSPHPSIRTPSGALKGLAGKKWVREVAGLPLPLMKRVALPQEILRCVYNMCFAASVM